MIKNFFLKFILFNNYINHHLTHLRLDLINFKLLNNSYNKYSFWNLNLDTFLISIFLSILFFIFIKYSINIKNKYKLNMINLLLEIIILFVYQNVIDIYGKKNKFVFSLAFSTFTWILITSLIGILPVDIIPYIVYKIFNWKYFIIVPSSDINFTFSISITTLFLIFLYKLYTLDYINIINNILYHPFNNKFLIPLNIILEIINYFSKIISLSLRLLGNIYSGEIIFILSYFFIPLWLQWIFTIPLIFLHILISFLQSFIFMILTIIYIS